MDVRAVLDLYVEFPEKRRLKVMEKTPEPLTHHKPFPKMKKMSYLMRGPELVHNQIVYGEYAVQALDGGRLRSEHLESIRINIIRNTNTKTTFSVWRIDPPWQAMTKKGVGQRMGSGKPAIKFYQTPIRAGRIILEIGGELELAEAMSILKPVTYMLPFKSRVVSRKTLEELNAEEENSEKLNRNPFTFKYCAKNNMLGIQKWLSPYDYIWYGKYR